MAGADQLEMMQALGVSEANLVTLASNADAISTVSTGRADAYAATSLTASGLAGQSDAVEVAGWCDIQIDASEFARVGSHLEDRRYAGVRLEQRVLVTADDQVNASAPRDFLIFAHRQVS